MYIFVLPEGFTILWFCSKTTWKCTIENEIKERGYTWGTIERNANNREELRKLVLVLCAAYNSVIGDSTSKEMYILLLL
jgi:septin family protein